MALYVRGLLVGGILIGAAAAQTVPAGWKIVTDRKGLCQIAVPADWMADKIMPSNVSSPDKKASVIVHGIAAPATYEQTVATAKTMFKPMKTFEESANRVWWSSTMRPGKTGESWYVAIGGGQVCDAQVEFQDPAFADTAKKIVGSFSAKK
jgi:hypothetical protein